MANEIKAQFATTVGRLVQGSILEMQTKKRDGTPLVDKKTGLPAPRAFIAVAFEKNAADWWGQTIVDPNPAAPVGSRIADPFFQTLYMIARQGYPQHFNAQGMPTHPRFAFKIADGDGMDEDGKPNNVKEGFKGNWVVKFGNGYLPKLIHNGAYIDQKDYVKRGYYVRVFGDITPNTGAEVPGVYVNHAGVELIAYGPEIKSGPDILAMAAAAGQYQLPAGATLTPPVPSTTPNMPPAAGAAMTPPPAGGFTPPPALQAAAQGIAPPAAGFTPPPAQSFTPPPAAAVAPPAGIVPNHGFVANAAQGFTPPAAAGFTPPPAQTFTPPPAAAPVAPPVPTMQPTAKAGGATLEQWHQAGYTDQMLIDQQVFVRA